MGKSSINGLCSMAMLNNQRVRPPIYSGWYSDGISVTIRQRFTPPSAPWHARRWRCLFLRQKGYNGYNTRNGGSMEATFRSVFQVQYVSVGDETVWNDVAANINRRVNLKSAGFHVRCVLEATQAPVGHSSPSNLLPWEVDVWTDRLIDWQIDRWIDR